VEVLQKINTTRIEKERKADEKAAKEIKKAEAAQTTQLTAQQGMEEVPIAW
jgi:hypothetical protein